MNDDVAARLAALRVRVDGLRNDAKQRPHLRFELENLIEQLEREANTLAAEAAREAGEGAGRSARPGRSAKQAA